MSRPIGTADELERRRRRAVQAVAGGQPRKTVAKVLGVHPKTVARWVRASRRPGGWAAKPQPGPTPGLSDAQLRRLEALLAKGAKAHGWVNRLNRVRATTPPTLNNRVAGRSNRYGRPNQSAVVAGGGYTSVV